MNSEIIGNRIKILMRSKHMTAKTLANLMQISYPTLIKKLNGKREFTNIDILKITEIFNLDINLCANIFFNPNFNIEKIINKTQKIS